MPATLSVYFDLTRLLAALVVLVTHAWHIFFPNYVLPWPGHHAVVVFFVLSGYVIAFVADQKETQLSEFLLSRAARILSVTIPALVYCTMVSYLVVSNWEHQLFIIAVNALFLGENWSIALAPSVNPVYWSLCYEVWYYAIFAGFAFSRTLVLKLIIGGALAFLAGPKILILMPCWLAGVALYWKRDKIKLSNAAAWAMFAVSIFAYGFFFWFDFSIVAREWLKASYPAFIDYLGASNQFVGDWILAGIVLINFVAITRLAVQFNAKAGTLSLPVKTAAGVTLSIYLFHYPSALLLSHYGVNGIAGFVLTLVMPIVFAPFTELRRFELRSAMRNVLRTLTLTHSKI